MGSNMKKQKQQLHKTIIIDAASTSPLPLVNTDSLNQLAPGIKRIGVTEFRANISATLEQVSIEPMLICNKRTQVNYVLITDGMFEQIASLAPQRVMAIIGGLKEDALDSVLQDIQKVQLSQNILLHDGIAPQEFSFK
tara:strand:+ start:799 stop:1212 length:414 start_codon:yes stop_codon:yes gene_type:complete